MASPVMSYFHSRPHAASAAPAEHEKHPGRVVFRRRATLSERLTKVSEPRASEPRTGRWPI